jgi:DNA-binding transcriptional ArsR family regulator
MDGLSTTFGALADPTRRAILARLAAGEATVTELAEPFAMSLPAVSKHLKVLEHAGLISRGRTAQWRPCRLEVAPLRQATDWLGEYRQFWEGGFDRLDEHLRELRQAAEEPRKTVGEPRKTVGEPGRRNAVEEPREGESDG